jgi:hypothetical protein
MRGRFPDSIKSTRIPSGGSGVMVGVKLGTAVVGVGIGVVVGMIRSTIVGKGASVAVDVGMTDAVIVCVGVGRIIVEDGLGDV